MKTKLKNLIILIDGVVIAAGGYLPKPVQRLVTPQIVKYGIIGVITQVIDFVTYLILVDFGVHYILADLLNTPFATGFNYVGHKYFTFTQNKWKNIEVGRYLLNLVFLYFYSTAVLFVFVDVLQLGPMVGKLAQIAAIPLINFVVLKLFVFRV